ncbi:MAG: hypothetical protein MZV63_05330 [Marinilabiliales bacterium]|nr:hypothetical protein [Marinilabiliales bacterium]
MKKIIRPLAILSLLVVTLCAAGQEGLLTLKIFIQKEFTGQNISDLPAGLTVEQGIQPLSASPGGKGTDIVRYDSKDR